MLKPEYSRLHRYRTLIMSLSVVVVFITTYLLILPALTLDRNTAGEQGGISLYSEATSDQTSSCEALLHCKYAVTINTIFAM